MLTNTVKANADIPDTGMLNVALAFKSHELSCASYSTSPFYCRQKVINLRVGQTESGKMMWALYMIKLKSESLSLFAHKTSAARVRPFPSTYSAPNIIKTTSAECLSSRRTQ